MRNLIILIVIIILIFFGCNAHYKYSDKTKMIYNKQKELI